MNLREARIRERRTALVRAPDCGRVGSLRVRRQVEDVSVAAGAEHHGIGGVRLDRTRDEIARHDSPRAAVDHDDVEHLGARIHPDHTGPDLSLEGLVRAEEQLLSGLTARVKRARDLCSAERAIGEQAAVLAGERHTLRDALVDDVHAELRKAVHVRLARAKVPALHRVVEQAIDGVSIVLIVLRRVDAALRRDTVGASRRILKAEALHVVAELRQRRRARASCEPAADHDDGVFPLVRGIHELHVEAMGVPLLLDRPSRNARAQLHRHGTRWKYTATGTSVNPAHTTRASVSATGRRNGSSRPRSKPSVRTELHAP